MVRLCSAGVLLSLLLLLGGCNLGTGGDGIVELTGTVLSIEDSVVTLDVSDTRLALRTDTICFVLKDYLEEGDGAYGPVVGDEVNFIYAKPLESGDPPVADVKAWGLPEYRMEGTLLSLDEEYAVIEPLDEGLRQELCVLCSGYPARSSGGDHGESLVADVCGALISVNVAALCPWVQGGFSTKKFPGIIKSPWRFPILCGIILDTIF